MCIVGAGPAGAVLAYLLARRGVEVTLLEAAHDFEREFRGDTLHPSVMELMEQAGLAQKILALPHGEVKTASLTTATRELTIADFSQLSLLTVRANRVKRWHKPGLLLLGDAAHAMTPVGGVGINLAIQDAAEAANVLTAPLLAGSLQPAHLAEVQRRRALPTRLTQQMQALVQRQVLGRSLGGARSFELPWLARFGLSLPGFRELPARFVGLGVKRVRLQQ